MLWQAHLRQDEDLRRSGDVCLLRGEVVVSQDGQIGVQIIGSRAHLPRTACWALRVHKEQPQSAFHGLLHLFINVRL